MRVAGGTGRLSAVGAVRGLKVLAGVAMAMVVVASAVLIAPHSSVAGAPVVIGGHRPEAPAVSGSRVVFSDNRFGSYDIFLYDGATRMTTRLTSDPTDEITPDISGDSVVYAVRGGSAGADIHAYDIPTRTVRVLAGGAGDQVNPSIDGRHVAWEDRAGGYAAQIWAIDLTSGAPFRVDPSNAAGYPRERPRVGGGYVVYEDYPRNNTTRDGDVMLYNIATKARTRVAGTTANEFVPVTDGTYVVWADGSGGDLDIKGYEIATGETFVVRAQSGEQTLPQVGAGLVYWMDNSDDGRLHVDVRDLDAGTTRPLDTYSVREVHAIATDGRAVAWLEPTRNGSQVRAILDPAAVTADAVAAMLPTTPAWTPFRLASVSTGGDGEAPEVLSASVEPGETFVDPNSTLTVYFDEPLDPDVSAGALSLTDESGVAVEGTVAYSGLARALTFTPAEPLAEGTFALTVEPEVADTAGNVSDIETVVTFSTVGALADVAAPSQPGNPQARVAGLTQIELTWQASNDDVGVDAYDIYRHSVPISSANLGSATLVTSVAGNVTSATFAAAPDERSPKKYTYYYALRARDASAKVSPLSANASPDPHGTYVVGGNTNNCMTCHSIHGAAPAGSWALGAKSSEACYECHGTTDSATGYGYASTFNTQARFWDYAANPLPVSGSRHRNDYMDAQNEECDGCHTPHRKPYNEVAGVYNAATSHSKLLKRPTDPADAGSAMVYNTDAAPFDKTFCFSCHGSGAQQISPSPLTYMTEVGGSSAYANTAGDHNEAGSANAAVAHSSANVYATLRVAGDPGPLNTCTACHNEHASATAGLVDYRQSDTTASTYDQAGLCFACHSAGSTETRSAGSAPFAWNGRDVQAEFQRTSHHPFAAAPPSGTPQLASWTQTTDVDFGSDTLTNASLYGTGAAASIGLAPSASPTIFSDGFESGFGAIWPTNTNWVTTTTDPYAGATAAVQSGTGAQTSTLISQGFSTTGRTNVQITFWRKGTNQTEDADTFTVSFRDGGGTWRTLQSWTLGQTSAPALAWTQYTVAVPGAYLGANTAVRLVAVNSDNANEAQRVDDVRVTADPPTTYVNSGSALTPPIAVTGGTLNSWQSLTFSGSQPAGSSLRVDVLNAATDSVIAGYSDLTLAGSPVSLSTIDKNANPAIKLRLRMTGNGTPSTVTPLLDEWTVSYVYTPAVSGASLACYNCHNTHYVNKGNSEVWNAARASNPDNTKQLYSGGNYNAFCLACHDGTAPTAVTNQAGTLVPYDVSMTDMSAYPFFPGWNKSETNLEFTGSAHGNSSIQSMTPGCQSCHDPHGSDNARLTAATGFYVGASAPASHPNARRNNTSTYAEEALCYLCHTSNRTPNCSASGCHTAAINNIDISAVFASTYKHPVATSGRHSDTEGPDGLGTANRHAECVDCHDPHATRPGRSTLGSSAGGGAVRGATGVKPVFSTGNWTGASSYETVRMTGQSTDYEAYICFKCHSSYTTLPAAATDMAYEFNPDNQSGHNVLGADTTWPKTSFVVNGNTRTWSFPTGSFTNPTINGSTVTMSTSYKLTCSDCHAFSGNAAGDPSGPHGSSVQYILRWGSGSTPWYTTTLTNWAAPQNICNRCHTRASNNVHTDGNHNNYTCERCHVRIPHGYKRPRLLVRYGTDPAPYATTTSGSLVNINGAKNYTPTNWVKSDCRAGCAGDHSSTPGTIWTP